MSRQLPPATRRVGQSFAVGQQGRRRLVGSTLVVAAALLGWLGYAAGLLAPLERLAYDQRTQWLRGEAQAPDEIVLLLLDEASLAALDPLVGRWPWPRSLWADLIEFFHLAQPAAVAFDILFSEAERGDAGAGDHAFAAETAAFGRVVHAAQLLETTDDPAASIQPLPPGLQERFAAPLDSATLPGPYHREYGLPLPALRDAAAAIGVVSAGPDADGVHRRLRPLHRYADAAYPALSVAALQVAGRAPAPLRLADETLVWGEQALALDPSGHALVNPYAEFEALSIAALFAALQQIRRGEVDALPVHPDELRGRIVFIGASAVGLHDLKATSLSARTPGVELHAALAGNLLTGELLRPAPTGWVSAAVLTAGLTALLVPALLLRIGLPLALIVGWSLWVYAQHAAGVVWEWSAVVVAALFAWLVSLLYLGFTEGRDRRRVRRLLAQYVSPAVLREVVDQRGGIATGEVGSSEVVTLLFSDVRGFTSLSEQHSPARVVELLNIHLGVMTQTIFTYQGTLDKFIGDAIMAFWGAPLRVPDHAERAVAAAVEMVRRLPEVNAEVVALGAAPLRIGIGLHSGEVILGNIGSEQKLDYTVIGDNVNAASRMEGLTKAYGCTVLLSGETHDALGDGFVCAFVDRLRVKGRKQPLDVYRPLAVPGDPPETLDRARHWAQISAAAYAQCRARNWDGAAALLAELPDDDPVRERLTARYRHYQHAPPPPDWDGAFTMESK